MFNPYEYMLEIRNNRILFQYLLNSAVSCSDETGWTIQGYSDEGTTEIYELATGIIRATLPIKVPSFVNDNILHSILDGLNPSLEGIVTIAEEDNELFIEYHLHFSINESSGLDKGLIKFVQEREEIKQGFKALEKDYENMKNAVDIMMRDPTSPNSNNGTSMDVRVPTTDPSIDSMDSLWNDMENIDKQDDEEDDDQDDEGGQPV